MAGQNHGRLQIAQGKTARVVNSPPKPLQSQLTHNTRGAVLMTGQKIKTGPDAGKSGARCNTPTKRGKDLLLGRTKGKEAQTDIQIGQLL